MIKNTIYRYPTNIFNNNTILIYLVKQFSNGLITGYSIQNVGFRTTLENIKSLKAKKINSKFNDSNMFSLPGRQYGNKILLEKTGKIFISVMQPLMPVYKIYPGRSSKLPLRYTTQRSVDARKGEVYSTTEFVASELIRYGEEIPLSTEEFKNIEGLLLSADSNIVDMAIEILKTNKNVLYDDPTREKRILESL